MRQDNPSERRGRPDWAVWAPAAVLLAMVGATATTLATMSVDPVENRVTEHVVTLQHDAGARGELSVTPDDTLDNARLATEALQPAERESGRIAVDKQIAEDAGVLGALPEGSTGGLEGGAPTGGVGGLIGASGEQLGSGGLGTRASGIGRGGLSSRGSGVGGGGSLGTKGLGSGVSGYGHGGGAFGAGRAPQAVVSTGAPTRFIDHGVNPVELTSRDTLSTFAVDVDTGSFTLARATLRGGALPDERAVRVEEFVNALDYDLAPPTGERPFAVSVEAAPNPHNRSHHLLKVSLKGAEPSIEDKPARLTFLVDTSCSMSDELPMVKQSLQVLVDHAGAEDSIAIATYAGSTRQVLQPTPVSRSRAIKRAIDSLTSQGGTAMNDGMVLAYQMASDHFVEGAENRVIVVSDGDANIGRASHQGILDSIAEHAGDGITLSTVGFGRGNYRDAMMEQLADKGDGNYVYIDSMDEARRVFGEKLGGMTRTIARDVKVQVDFDEEAVLAWRLVGYENRDVADEDFRNDAVDGGEIGAGHEVTALYDVVLADDLDDNIATVHLRAKPPGRDAPAVEWSVPFGTESIHAELGDASRDLKLASATALFAEILRGSAHVDELDYDDVLDMLRSVPPTTEVRGLRDMVLQAQRLSGPATLARQAGVLTDTSR